MSERIGDTAGNEPLIFIGDHASEFIVDSHRLIRPIPEITGMKVVDNYNGWFLKKLFIFSAGHATTAYLGYLKGYHYIHSAILDPEIRAAVLAAMREGQQGLAAEYGAEVAGDETTLQGIVTRFENAALNDSIDRVGRDPLRKLGKKDRLIGAAEQACKAGVNPEKLMLAVAAALYYCDQSDPACVPMREELETAGPGKLLRSVSGIDPDIEMAVAAEKIFSRLVEKGDRSPLLSLEDFFWA
jgi:mannitol-1-phosphate 5-dehydrogenase